MNYILNIQKFAEELLKKDGLFAHIDNSSKFLVIIENIINYYEDEEVKKFHDRSSESLQTKITEKLTGIKNLNSELASIQSEGGKYIDAVSNYDSKKTELENKKKKLDNDKKKVVALQNISDSIKELSSFLKHNDLYKTQEQYFKSTIDLISALNETAINIKGHNDDHAKKLKNSIIKSDKLTKEAKGLKLEIKNFETSISESKERIKGQNIKLNRIISEDAALREKLTSLKIEIDEVNKIYENNSKIFNSHFKSDSEIWGNINEKGKLVNHVNNNLISPITNKLKEFDNILKDIILKQADIKISEYKK